MVKCGFIGFLYVPLIFVRLIEMSRGKWTVAGLEKVGKEFFKAMFTRHVHVP